VKYAFDEFTAPAAARGTGIAGHSWLGGQSAAAAIMAWSVQDEALLQPIARYEGDEAITPFCLLCSYQPDSYT
jgi:hypothetical protein